MAISFDPVGIEREQTLIGRRRLAMLPAIAEQPGTDMKDRPLVRGLGKGTPAAFEGFIMTAVVIQRRGQVTVQVWAYACDPRLSPQVIKAKAKLSGIQSGRKAEGVDI